MKEIESNFQFLTICMIRATVRQDLNSWQIFEREENSFQQEVCVIAYSLLFSGVASGTAAKA